MNLRSHFHFNSFPGHSPRFSATQRKREKRNTKQTHTQQHNELRSTHSNTERKRERAPIHISYLRSTPIHELERSDPCTATQRERENELRSRNQSSDPLRSTNQSSDPRTSAPINERAPIQLSQTHIGPATSVTEPNTYHGELSVTSSPSTHLPHLRLTHVRSTHSPHRSDLCIYIYIYIYLFTFFFIYYIF